MIQSHTYLNVSDNSGAKLVQCIKTLKVSKYNYATIGDIIVIVIKDCNITQKVKKGNINYAMIIRTKKEFKKINNILIKFNTNDVILLTDRSSYQPIGTRIFGPILYELKNNSLYKSIFLSSQII